MRIFFFFFWINFIIFVIPNLTFLQSVIEVLHVKKYIEVPKDLKSEKRLPIKYIDQKSLKNYLKYFSITYIRIHYNKYDNRIYVVDPNSHKIIIFDYNLDYIGELGSYGQGPGEYVNPIDINFEKNGNFVISDERLKIARVYNKNFDLLTEVKIVPLSHHVNAALFDLYGNVITYSVLIDSANFILNGRKLFTSWNIKGEKVIEFGELLNFKINSKLSNYLYNSVKFIFDKDGFLYCVFRDHPIIRKYDPIGNLIFEADYCNIPVISKRLKSWEKEYKNKIKKSKTLYSEKGLIHCLSIDNNYLYAKFTSMENPVYLFDKKEFKIIKRIEFYDPDNEKTDIIQIDTSSENHIYAITSRGNLVKFNK